MKKLLFIIFVLQSLVDADVSSVDTQIQKIRSASPQERVKLMNEFKLRVSQMNREERSHILKKMQTKMRTRARQKREGQEVAKYQNMNQHQMGNQLAHKQHNKKR